MFIIINRNFFKWFTANWVCGIALFPFIIVKNKQTRENKILVHHEQIHIRQQIELLILPFFIWYGLEYLYRLIQYKNKIKAYQNISFEREAFSNELNFKYLSKRKTWSFIKYL